MARVVAVLGLYALVVALSLALAGSLFVTPLLFYGTIGPLIVYGAMSMLGLVVYIPLLEAADQSDSDSDFERGKFMFLPLGLAMVTTMAAALATEFESIVRSVVGSVSLITLQAGSAVLVLAVLVLVAVPVAAHHVAWGRIEAVSTDHEGSAGGDQRLAAVGEGFAAEVPDRLDVRVLDESKPAVYLFDDGRTATLAFTDGAVDVLDEREREAVVARELVRVLERAAVPSFWASALALRLATLVDPVATEPYESRAGGTVRLPFWFVAPVKVLAAVFGLGLFYGWPIWLVSEYLPVPGPMLVVAYAVGTVLVAFGLAKAAAWVARRVAIANVQTADEHGAVLADDADALASAIRTLEEAREERSESDPEDDEFLGALDVLSHCPTDAVALDDRLAALEDVADRLDGRSSDPPAATTTGNASS